MQLRDRLRRLEAAAVVTIEPLSEIERKQLDRWPEMLLERYCEGRLDVLAAAPDLPIGKLLEGLAEQGYAISAAGCWHPLFLGADTETNARVIARIESLDNGDAQAATTTAGPTL